MSLAVKRGSKHSRARRLASTILVSQTTGAYENVGEPTEAALRVLVEKIQTDDAKFNASLARHSPIERYDPLLHR